MNYERKGGATALELIRSIFTTGSCKNCGGRLDGRAYLCKSCADAAERLSREHEARMVALAAEERRALYAGKITMVPRAFRDVRFANLDGRVARREAIDRAKRAIGSPIVTIQGVAGTGKTSLAAAMFGACIDGAVAGDARMAALAESAVWTNSIAIARARREHPLGQGEAPLIVECRLASMLVVDDLGLESERESEREAISTLLYERHADDRATVVTVGFGASDLKQKYGDGIMRRLTQKSYATVIRTDINTDKVGA